MGGISFGIRAKSIKKNLITRVILGVVIGLLTGMIVGTIVSVLEGEVAYRTWNSHINAVALGIIGLAVSLIIIEKLKLLLLKPTELKIPINENQSHSIIVIDNKFPLLAWAMVFTRPVVEIDGAKHYTNWGQSWYKVTDGEHTIRVYHRWFHRAEAGLSETKIKLKPGETYKLCYTAPLMVYGKGKLETLNTVYNDEESYVCSECNSDVSKEDKICPNCGANLED